MGMSAAATGVITVLSLTYALDAYKDLDGEVGGSPADTGREGRADGCRSWSPSWSSE
jgi:hypothetical protein